MKRRKGAEPARGARRIPQNECRFTSREDRGWVEPCYEDQIIPRFVGTCAVKQAEERIQSFAIKIWEMSGYDNKYSFIFIASIPFYLSLISAKR